MNWIDIKEDLPDYSQKVILYTVSNDYNSKYIFGELNKTDINGHNFIDQDGQELEDVTHWCKIIKPGIIKR